jgi:molecular chaperone GrpE
MTKKATKRSESKELNKETKVKKQQAVNRKTAENKNIKREEIKAEKQTEDQKKKVDVRIEKLNAEIEELKEQFTDAEENGKIWHDKYMRLSAEFDNYRKRTLKEKAELTKLANANLLKDILPVIDDFERGIAHLDDAEDMESLKKGVELIYNKFVEFLRQNNIKEIEAKEKEFDLDFHEAMTKIPAPTDELKGKVVDVLEKGYLLNDKVIRYAKVVVGE